GAKRSTTRAPSMENSSSLPVSIVQSAAYTRGFSASSKPSERTRKSLNDSSATDELEHGRPVDPDALASDRALEAQPPAHFVDDRDASVVGIVGNADLCDFVRAERER